MPGIHDPRTRRTHTAATIADTRPRAPSGSAAGASSVLVEPSRPLPPRRRDGSTSCRRGSSSRPGTACQPGCREPASPLMDDCENVCVLSERARERAPAPRRGSGRRPRPPRCSLHTWRSRGTRGRVRRSACGSSSAAVCAHPVHTAIPCLPRTNSSCGSRCRHLGPGTEVDARVRRHGQRAEQRQRAPSAG